MSRCGSMGGTGPLERAEQRQGPADSQAGQAGVKSGGAHAVVHRRHTGAPGQCTNLLAELRGVFGVGEHLVGAGLPGQSLLFSRRDGGDDPDAEQACPLRQDQPDAAGARMHQHRVAALHGIHRLQQVVRGQALQQHRSRHLGSHAVWHLGGQKCWRSGEFGVAAVRRGADHPVARAEPVDSFTDSGDRAAHLGADDERQLARIVARAEIGVDEVDADGLGLDQQLALPGCGLRRLDVAQDLGAAGFTDFDCVHVDIMPGHEARSARRLPSPHRAGGLSAASRR